MVNPFREIDWNPDREKLVSFGRTLLIGFTVIGAVLLITGTLGWVHPRPWLRLLYAAGSVIGLFCMCLPQFARPFYRVWFALGASVGIVTSNLALMAAYFILLTPVALIFRAIGRDALKRRFEPDAKSYWENTARSSEPERYFKQF